MRVAVDYFLESLGIVIKLQHAGFREGFTRHLHGKSTSASRDFYVALIKVFELSKTFRELLLAASCTPECE